MYAKCLSAEVDDHCLLYVSHHRHLLFHSRICSMKTLAQTNKDKAAPLVTLVGQMYSAQGIAGFYRGVEANVMRACVLNATKMGCYDVTKGYVVDYSTSN